ncbi:hypothetical protein EKO27_g7979 [Xylaria grammica]|uniref:Uncharacterized protein n=1 Tax=Xylaria grammica TaxID=363999 RepID=A0A439CYB9_9PEZI|nr:hypothetical protein EKO27_g7979 [Xylaria grammica]
MNQPAPVSEHATIPFTNPRTEFPARPATRREFEIAIICALTPEADAVEAIFDKRWDNNGPPYDKAPGDPNAYTTGAIGRHNVVLAHMPGMGKANAAAVAANCRASYPNIRLAIVAGICGAVPFDPNDNKEIILGDVIISTGVIQYDFGRRHTDRFVRKDTLLDSLGRPNTEIRALLAKLEGRTSRRELQKKIAAYLEVAQRDSELKSRYQGVINDRLFEANYRHVSEGKANSDCNCTGPLVKRERLLQGVPQPDVHFGFIASGDTVMRSGKDRDDIAQQERVLGFDMEGAGVWDNFPCIIIKGACDYADSHKTKLWQPYAAASAASCVKGFLEFWVPSMSFTQEPRSIKTQPTRSWSLVLVPYPRNNNFVGRAAILEKLQQLPLKSTSQTRASLFGLGGVGKTQIAIEYAYRLRDKYPDMSVFWVRASSVDQFRQSFHSIALECGIPGHNDPKSDVLPLVKKWLERNDQGWWAMIIDNADDAQLFFSTQPDSGSDSRNDYLSKYIPECSPGSIFVTTKNKQVGIRLTKGMSSIEICKMDNDESQQLLRSNLGEEVTTPTNLLELSSQLEHLPLALAQASAFIQEKSITVDAYLELLNESDQHLINLLSEEFETVGRDSGATHAVAATLSLSFEQIERQDALASELLSLMSLFDRQGIPMEFLSDFIKRREGHSHQENVHNVQLVKALGVLKAYSLVTEKKDNDFDMHRLVQLATRKWLVAKETMSRFAGEALLTISHCYPYCEHETRETCTAYLPHVQSILKLELPRSMDKGVERSIILHNTSSHFRFQGQWKRAEEFQTQAMEIRKKTHGPDDSSTGKAENSA